ncbi:hypothetical protein Tco_0360076 [Tanacetum coccineum]
MNDNLVSLSQLQLQARSQKEMSIKWFRVLQGNTRFLLREDFISLNNIDEGAFKQAFLQLFGEELSTVKRIFSQNMDTLEEKLTKEKLHDNDFKNALTTLMTPFKKTMIHNIAAIEKYLIEAILHEHEILENNRAVVKRCSDQSGSSIGGKFGCHEK